MYGIVKGALWSTFCWDWIIAATFGLVGECTGIFSCYFISHLIDYLRDESAPSEDGIKLVAIFMAVNIVSQLCRNFYIHFGFLTSIRMRRTLVNVIFEKVINLSMKSLIATNSGKLISVISSDLYACDKTLTFAPLVLVCPFANLLAYSVIGLTSSWINSLIVFSVWIFMLLV